ncbi:MAG: aspartoacylase [Cryomorphaceae bacterium]|nr:MAG: aspartoacylase [Cryomorphaceae bacterium]
MTGERVNDRLIFSRNTLQTHPTVVFFAGIHGNEPAGVLALERIANWLPDEVQGNIYAFRGNLRGLAQKRRFVRYDLNRIWGQEQFNIVRNAPIEELEDELLELRELLNEIDAILHKHGKRPVVFMDLHTTSAKSCSFLPFNDALMNRAIAERFPVPLILGIEEFLDGALMSYINDLNHPALAFEGGQHDDPAAIDQHEAFAKLTLHHLKIFQLDTTEKAKCEALLTPPPKVQTGFYEILHRHLIPTGAEFIMEPGYENFDFVELDEALATQDGRVVSAPVSGQIFLPLYQPVGEDGFFIGRPVSAIWLRLSARLRKWRFQRVLAALPGISPHPTRPRCYLVNHRVTRILSREIFHLLGFRIKQLEAERWLLIQRD